MLFFKKNIVLLKDMIPDDYIDIHSHLLPNIDDGAKNINETMSLLINLQKIGFSKIITSPHIYTDVWNNTNKNISQKEKETSKNLLDVNINIPLKTAAEYMLDSNFHNLLTNNEPLLELKDNLILVEMSYLYPPEQLYQIIFDLQIANYIPVLAHPERYKAYHNRLSEYDNLKTAGCMFQLNLLSTVGYYGNMETKISDYLLKNDMIDYVGSDVHHQKHIDFFSNKVILKNKNKLEIAINKNRFFDFSL